MGGEAGMKMKIVLLFTALLLMVGCGSTNQNVESFIDKYSSSYPYVEPLIDLFEVVDNRITLLEDDKSMLVFSFSTELTFEEINQLILSYGDYLVSDYNPSMSGNMNMEENGYLNYLTTILENKQFSMSITNINNVKILKKDNKEDKYLKDVGKDNILVRIKNLNNQ